MNFDVLVVDKLEGLHLELLETTKGIKMIDSAPLRLEVINPSLAKVNCN